MLMVAVVVVVVMLLLLCVCGCCCIGGLVFYKKNKRDDQHEQVIPQKMAASVPYGGDRPVVRKQHQYADHHRPSSNASTSSHMSFD